MKSLNIHPHIGFLNTKFSIRATSSKGTKLKIYHTINEEFLIDEIEIKEDYCNNFYTFPTAGNYRIELNDQSIYIEVKDAIKLGGSTHKESYIFDNCPYCFITMLDRTYFYNIVTGEQYVESISPDKIQFINKDVILLSNDNCDYSLYSLEQQKPFLNFPNYIYLNDDTLIRKDVIEDIVYISVYTFTTHIPVKTTIECSDFSLDEDNGLIYIVENNIIKSYKLHGFIVEKSVTIKSDIIGFTNNHIVILKKENNSISLFDLKTERTIGELNTEFPISKIENLEIEPFIQANNNSLANITDYLKERYSLLQSCIELKIETSEIQKIIVIDQKILFIEFIRKDTYKEGKTNTIYEQYLKYEDGSVLLKLKSRDYGFLIVDNLLIIKDDLKYYEIKEGQILYETEGNISFRNKGAIIRHNEPKGLESLELRSSNYNQLLDPHKYSFQYFDDFGIIYVEDEKKIYSVFNAENFISFSANTPSYLGWSRKFNKLSYGNLLLFFNSKAVYMYPELNLPDNLEAISDSLLSGITIRGTHIYLETRNSIYESTSTKEILTEIFDSSSYGNVFLSDEGNHIIYQKDAKMHLLNTDTNETQVFDNLHFIGHKNGYKPLFKFDYFRKPVLIDPLTKREINNEHLGEYTFESPDSKLYAETSIKKKYFNKLNNTYISETEYKNLYNKYNSSQETEKTRVRKELARNYPSFDGFKTSTPLDRVTDFLSLFIEISDNVIVKTKEGNTKAEIKLEEPLQFLNYISFSFDSRYVGIVGKKKCGSLLLIYDLHYNQVVFNGDYHYAIWTIAFSRDNTFAAYDSQPITFYGKIKEQFNCKLPITYKNQEEILKIITGRNFITFNSDGTLIALSDKKYIPYNDKYKWGHQPSTNIYIYSIYDIEKQLIPTISDLSACNMQSERNVSSCCFSNDNKKLMMTGSDGTVIIRNLHLEETGFKIYPKGKLICNTLKEIRKKIAKENNIEYSPDDCKNEGNCKGTCPKCEQEYEYIRKQLEIKQEKKESTIITNIAPIHNMNLSNNQDYSDDDSVLAGDVPF